MNLKPTCLYHEDFVGRTITLWSVTFSTVERTNWNQVYKK